MQQKNAIMMRVLINRYHKGSLTGLLEGLSADAAKQVLDQEIPSADPSQVIIEPEDLFHGKIHYSWLVPVLESYSPKMQPIFLSALPRDFAKSLSILMRLPLLPRPLPPIRKQLLLSLCSKFCKRTVLPVEFLPETPLTPLATLTKVKLLELIDYLGIYDLAEEIRHIVDKKLLKMIYACLTPKKQLFLHTCLHQKEKLKATKIGLINWKGDGAQLERLLHRRGLMRLSFALSGQPRDFVWHLVHRLDVGRGRLLGKQFSDKEISGVSTFLAQQVITTLNFLKRMSSHE